MRTIATIILLFIAACARTETAAETEPSSRQIPDALAPYVSVNAEKVLLTNVTILKGDGGDPLAGHAILIDGETIAAVAPVDDIVAPNDALVMDLAGYTVMPGIVGMHNHTHMPGNPLLAYTAPRLYLAGGVTTMTTAGSADGAGEIELARRIDKGEIPGPHIVPSAPYITGPGGNAPMDKPKTAAEVQAFVDKWSDAGAKWLKLYRHTDPKIAKLVIDAAHARGLKVTGHLCSITFREAAAMGIDSLEHGLNAAADFVEDKPDGECVPTRSATARLDADGPEIGALIAALVDADVTITSTLAIIESGFPHRPQANERSLRALAPARVEAYEERQRRLAEAAGETSATPELWSLLLAFERRFVREGGRLVAGPDTGRHVLPGFGDQRNFELLSEAGFTAPEVVKIMTYNGAETLGLADEIGLVAPGFQADLLAVEGDLLSNPANIRNVRIVFKRGLGYDPERLIADVEGQVGER